MTRPKRRIDVGGPHMAYVDAGSGARTFVMLHGNPTSSFLWRHVIDRLETEGRCLAPDLIGMGDSDRSPATGPSAYAFAEHAGYLERFLDADAVPHRLVLVLHDWGCALGFDWARRHPQRVAGIAYMEGLVRPPAWSEFGGSARPLFEALRSPAGEQMVLEDNVFVEQILPSGMLRELEPEELAEYRRPFREPGEGRRATLAWPRQIPLDGEPAEVAGVVAAYATWLSTAPIPKLFVNAEPGALLTGAQRAFCRSWPHQREVSVRGLHFIQEDSAGPIAEAIADWVRELPA